MTKYALPIAFLGAIGYGGLLELVQCMDFLQRSCDWIDFAANSGGVIGAGILVGLIRLPWDPKAGFWTLLALTCVVMTVMLYFGLRLRAYRPVNQVEWSTAGGGIILEPFGMAYTNGFFASSTGNQGNPGIPGLTMEMAITPDFSAYSSFRFLVLVHDGRDADQLFIGQWGSSLMIMNGDDYSNRRRLPKLYLQLDEKVKGPRLVSIVSNEAGTKVYLDGVLKKTSAGLILRFPGRAGLTRLVVGNSLSGNQPWTGKISGLAFYDLALGEALTRQHYQVWQSERTFNGFKDAGPRLLYTFDEGRGEIVHNKMGDGPVLMIPQWMKILQKKVLAWPKLYGVTGSSLMGDVLLNLIGFVPLGFILIALFSRIERLGAGYRSLAVVLIAFVFSLSIEVTQGWIPSRDSSLLDLILNTLGGFLGVLFFKWMRIRITSHLSPI